MDSANVSAAKPKTTGAVFCAPLGTAMPTDAVTALSADYLPLGYVSEDGVSNSNSPSSSSTKAWGGDVVLDSQTEKADTFKIPLIEAMNINVLKLVYGDNNVTGKLDEGIKVTANRTEAAQKVIVVDMILKDAVKRIVIPRAKLVEMDEIAYVDGKPISYGAKFSAAPDKDGNTHYEYIKATSAAN